MTRLAAQVPLVAVMLVAGCGSSSKTASSSSSAPPAEPAASASWPLTSCQAGEVDRVLAGKAHRRSDRGPAAWDKGEAGERPNSAPNRRGLSRRVTVQTTGSNRGGVAFVLELGTLSAAQHEVAARFKQLVAEQHPSSDSSRSRDQILTEGRLRGATARLSRTSCSARGHASCLSATRSQAGTYPSRR